MSFRLGIGDDDPNGLDLRGPTYSASFATGPWITTASDGSATMAFALRVVGPNVEAAWNALARKLYVDAPRGADPQLQARSNLVLIQRIAGTTRDAYIDVLGWDPPGRDAFRPGWSDYSLTLITRAYARGAPVFYDPQAMPDGGGAIWLGEVPGVFPALARIMALDVSTGIRRIVSWWFGQHAGSLLTQADQTPLIAAASQPPAYHLADTVALGGTEARLTATDGSWKPVARFYGPTGGRHNRRARAYVRARSAAQVVGTPLEVSAQAEQGAGNLTGGDWIYVLANIDANGRTGPLSSFAMVTIYHVPAVRQTITAATGGTYHYEFGGETTQELPVAASVAQAQAALENLGTIGVGNVSVTGGAAVNDVWQITPAVFAPPANDVWQLTPGYFTAPLNDAWTLGFDATGGGGADTWVVNWGYHPEIQGPPYGPDGTYTLTNADYQLSLDGGPWLMVHTTLEWFNGYVWAYGDNMAAVIAAGGWNATSSNNYGSQIAFQDAVSHSLAMQYVSGTPSILTHTQTGGGHPGAINGSGTANFSLTWNGRTATNIAFTASYSAGIVQSITTPTAADLQATLRSAWSTTEVNVTSTGTGYRIEFVGSLGRSAQPAVSVAKVSGAAIITANIHQSQVGGGTSSNPYTGTESITTSLVNNDRTAGPITFSSTYSGGAAATVTPPAVQLQTILRNAWGALDVNVTLAGGTYTITFVNNLGRAYQDIYQIPATTPPNFVQMALVHPQAGGSSGVPFTGTETTRYSFLKGIQSTAEMAFTATYAAGVPQTITAPTANALQVAMRQAWGDNNVNVTLTGVTFTVTFVGALAGAPQQIYATKSTGTPTVYADLAMYHQITGAPPGDRIIAISGPYAPSGTLLRAISSLEGVDAAITITPLTTGALWQNRLTWQNGDFAVATAIWSMRVNAAANIPLASLWYKRVVNYTTQFLHQDPADGVANSPPPAVMPDTVPTQVRIASGAAGGAQVVAGGTVIDLSGNGRYEWRDAGPVALPPVPVRQGLGAPPWFAELQATNPGQGGDTVDCDSMIYVDDTLPKASLSALDLAAPGLLWDFNTDPDLRPSAELRRATDLMSNPTFETGVGGWVAEGQTATITPSTAEAHSGTGSGLFASAGSLAVLRNSNPYAWRAGDVLHGRIWLKGAAGAGGAAQIVDGGTILAERLFTTTGDWQEMVLEVTAQADSAFRAGSYSAGVYGQGVYGVGGSTSIGGTFGLRSAADAYNIQWYVDDGAFWVGTMAATASPSGPLLLGPGPTSLACVPSVADDQGGSIADAIAAKAQISVQIVPRYPIAAEDA